MPPSFDSLLGNPAAMAGLALLMQPTRSRTPLNPGQSVMSGLMGAAQYRQQQAITAGQQQELEMRRQALQFEAEQARAQAARQAEADALRAQQRQQVEAAIAALPPEQQPFARANPEAFFKQWSEAQFAQPKAPTSLLEFQAAQSDPAYAAYLESQKPKQASEPLVQVMGPNGPVWVPRSQAAGMPAAGGEGSVPKLSDYASLRKEYQTTSAQWTTRKAAYESIQAARPTAAGDISLVFSYMRMLDPGSVVREGEFATAQNAAGVPTQIRNAYNRALSGERLAPAQRDDFKAQARALLDSELSGQLQRESEYRSIAERAGMRPEDIVRDLIGPYRTKAPKSVTEPLSREEQAELDALRAEQGAR